MSTAGIKPSLPSIRARARSPIIRWRQETLLLSSGMAGPRVFEGRNRGIAIMNQQRSGTTLVEVLVAIFVTAIGLLGLLALFPLGAVSLAQAIKDSRC